jgi:HK97 family phage major capsid protein
MDATLLNKALDGIEAKLQHVPTMQRDVNDALTKARRAEEQALELADRMLTLEQRGLNAPPADLRMSPRDPEDGVHVLRSAADFRNHFRGNSEPVGLRDFLKAVCGMKASAAATKSLSVGIDTAGGFLVPTDTAGRLMAAMVPASTVLQAGCGVLPVPAAKLLSTAVVNAIPTPAWRNEGGLIAESPPTFRSVVTTPRSLAFRFSVTRELLMDAPQMDQKLNDVIGQAMAKAWDYTALRGSGTAPEPRGIRNTTGVHVRGKGDNGGAGPTWDDLISAYADILSADCPPPKAVIMSPRSWKRLFGATDLQGQPLQAPDALRGLRFLVTSQLPENLTTGTSTDTSEVIMGDFACCDFMMREGATDGGLVTVQMTDNDANTGRVTFIAHLRGDFTVWYPQAFAVITGVR